MTENVVENVVEMLGLLNINKCVSAALRAHISVEIGIGLQRTYTNVRAHVAHMAASAVAMHRRLRSKRPLERTLSRTRLQTLQA